MHPLELEQVNVNQPGTEIKVRIKNHHPQPVKLSVGDIMTQIGPRQSLSVDLHPQADQALQAYPLVVKGENLPTLRRTVFIYSPSGKAEWTKLDSGELVLRVAQDGSVVELQKDNKVVAIIAPLVHCAGKIPHLNLIPRWLRIMQHLINGFTMIARSPDNLSSTQILMIIHTAN